MHIFPSNVKRENAGPIFLGFEFLEHLKKIFFACSTLALRNFLAHFYQRNLARGPAFTQSGPNLGTSKRTLDVACTTIALTKNKVIRMRSAQHVVEIS